VPKSYAALKAIERLNALTLPIERDTEGEYLPELPELQPGAIHVVDANMNSGKTYRIGRDWVQRALAAGHHVLVLSPLNALGKQTAKDWGISHIHDQGVTASEQKAFWTALQNRPGVVLCPDSIAKLPQWFWSKPVLLVLDEANQVTEHMCQGNTLKSRYSAVNERLADAARYAIESGGAVVLSEDGIPDRAVKFWQSVSGAESVRCIRHRKQGVPWDCTVYGGSVTLFRARLLSATKQQRILFVTSSQREAKRLHRILEGTGCKVTRIDSETNQQGAFNDFFKAPTEWLQTHRPDVLILSPSAKSGVSIEGGVTAEDAYFDQVWGYFPSLATDTHMQLLGRYRPSVPRLMFMPPFILGSGDESLFTPKAVKQRLQRNLDTVAHLFNCDTDPVAAGLELAILDYLSEALAVSGSQKRIPQPAIITRLEAAGHVVDIEKLEGSDKGISKLWRETQEQIWQDEAQEIAHLTIADDLDKDWARETLDSMESTRENRLIAHKVLWRDEFPGVMFDDLDECYQALCNNYGTMRRGVILQARAENLDATKDGERDAIERNLNGRVRAAHRLPTAYIKAGIIAQMGVLALLDGKSWSNTDKRAIAIKTKALKYRDEIRYYLRLNIKPDQTPSEIANKLIRKLGLETLSISRPGARDAKRDRLYLVEDADNPVRARLLEALRGKLSDSVSTICNKDSELLQIVDTGPPSPPPQGIEGGCWLLGDVVRVASTGVTALIEDITRGLATLGTEAGEILQAPLADLIAT
jgi:ribosomal protein L11 methylase PrmA